MSTKINVEILDTIRPVTNTNKGLVILIDTDLQDGVTGKVFEIGSVRELKDTLKVGVALPIKSRLELAQTEFLLRQGVSLVALRTTLNNLKTDLEDLIEENEDNYGIKVVVAPGVDNETNIGEIAEAIKDYGDGTIEYHITISDIDELGDIDTEIGSNRNVSIFVGRGLLGQHSAYNEEGKTYIDAGVAAMTKKLLNLENEVPWLPIAGEDTGVFPEFLDVETRLSRAQKEAYQAANVNPLVVKTGVGVYLVAQNTRAKQVSTSPINRAHANTLINYLVTVFKTMGDKYKQRANNSTTWNAFKLEASKVLRDIMTQDGLEQFAVSTGRREMTESDIANGIFKAKILLLPVRVIEAVVLQLVVQDNFEPVVELLEGAE